MIVFLMTYIYVYCCSMIYVLYSISAPRVHLGVSSLALQPPTTFVGFCAKRDLCVLHINNEKWGDKCFLNFVCEYNANIACKLYHDCITTSVHVGASFRRPPN